jgi:apolipoprotein N-acyltransferase
MIRVANNGVSASVDARGRIIAKLGLDEVGAVDSELHQPIAPTTYAKFGDNLYWGVWLILLLLLNIAGCRKKLLGI